jgi:uncharacterized protein YndB with AHSA1/START domain
VIVKLKYGIYLDKQIDHVFEYLRHPANMEQWQATMLEVRGVSGLDVAGRLQVGARVSDRRKVLGQDITGEWEVTEMEPQRRLALRVTQGALWETIYSLESMDGGTFLTAETTGDLGMVPVSAVAAHRACQRYYEEDLNTLADIMEK